METQGRIPTAPSPSPHAPAKSNLLSVRHGPAGPPTEHENGAIQGAVDPVVKPDATALTVQRMVELSVPLEMHMIPLTGHEYLADQYMTMAMDFFQKHTGVLAHPPVIKPQPGILWGGIAMITPATANKTASLDLRTAPLGAAMEPVTVDVARDATVIIDGQDAKFDDLTRGMRIKATQSATGAVSKIEVTTGNPRKSPPPAK